MLFRSLDRPGRDVWQGLVDRDVLVRDCSSWPHLDNCLRVTVGTPDENTEFLDALPPADPSTPFDWRSRDPHR